MTFNQLRYVVEAAKIGSISKAARLLFLTQSNLSSTILSLEKELGIKPVSYTHLTLPTN